MKKLLSMLLATIMIVCALPISAHAATTQNLVSPTGVSFTKTTDKYDGFNFVQGTTATWTTREYSLKATATSVSGSKVTFAVTFNPNVEANYQIRCVANGFGDTFNATDNITYTVDTDPEVDPGRYQSEVQFIQFKVINGSQEDVYALMYLVTKDAKFEDSTIKVGKTSVSFPAQGYDSIVQYRVKGAKEWKSKKSFSRGSTLNITGLKAGTSYEFLPLFKYVYDNPETGKKEAVVDYALHGYKYYSITTAIDKKPQVTSVKIGKIKYGKQTINGYWESDGDWHPTETFNTATYTMTVKVKNVPKNAKGLYLKIGGSTYYAKGKKTTYTFKNMTYRDRVVKGKQLKATFAYSSNSVGNNPLGLGPSKTVKYKLKTGTYK